MDIFKNLNEKQKEAVSHISGPLLVVAGAGAGKTKVITHRIANLIKNKVRPEQILAVTFTNKAANEMKERVSQLLRLNLDSRTTEVGSLEIGLRRPTIGTFHSVCARILRENARAVGLPRNFSILDKNDSLKIIKKALKDLSIDPKQFQPKKMQAIISRQKSELIDHQTFSETAGEDFFPKNLSLIWQEYEKNLAKQKSLDFDDLISKPVFLFKKRPEILKRYQNKWLYLLIDEYQDTNHCQYILSKLLAQKSKNICAVGDTDQSIYRFRGANFGNVLNFEKDWPKVKTVTLEQNYRSTQNILDAANAVIKQNKTRKPKNLFSKLKKGNNLIIIDAENEKEEANLVANVCQNLLSDGKKPSDVAILYRANFQSRVLEESFLYHEIPYQVLGTKFFERKEIKDIIAYIKVALNPNNLLSVERIINEPTRGIGKASLLNHLSGKKLTKDKEEKIKKFWDLLKNIKQTLQQESLAKSILFIIEKTGYKNHLDDGSEEGIMRIENLMELITLSKKYDGMEPLVAVEKFLEETALLGEQDNMEEKKEAVRLMTVHAAKGLEFPYIFAVGLEDGLFPFTKLGSTIEDEEEERRLFYVALTRAKEQIFLSFAHSRNFYGGRQMNKPSRFIKEIPEKLFSFEDGENELPTTNYLET